MPRGRIPPRLHPHVANTTSGPGSHPSAQKLPGAVYLSPLLPLFLVFPPFFKVFSPKPLGLTSLLSNTTIALVPTLSLEGVVSQVCSFFPPSRSREENRSRFILSLLPPKNGVFQEPLGPHPQRCPSPFVKKQLIEQSLWKKREKNE